MLFVACFLACFSWYWPLLWGGNPNRVETFHSFWFFFFLCYHDFLCCDLQERTKQQENKKKWKTYRIFMKKKKGLQNIFPKSFSFLLLLCVLFFFFFFLQLFLFFCPIVVYLFLPLDFFFSPFLPCLYSFY